MMTMADGDENHHDKDEQDEDHDDGDHVDEHVGNDDENHHDKDEQDEDDDDVGLAEIERNGRTGNLNREILEEKFEKYFLGKIIFLYVHLSNREGGFSGINSCHQ